MKRIEHNTYLIGHAVLSYGVTAFFFIALWIGYLGNSWRMMNEVIILSAIIEGVLLLAMCISSITIYKRISYNSFLKIGWAITFHSIYEMVVIALFISHLEDDEIIQFPSIILIGLIASILYLIYSKWIKQVNNILNDVILRWKCILPKAITYFNRFSIAGILWFAMLILFLGDVPIREIIHYSVIVMTLYIISITIRFIQINKARLWYGIIGIYSLYIIVIFRFLTFIYYLDALSYERINNAILVLYIVSAIAIIGYIVSIIINKEYKWSDYNMYDIVVVGHIVLLFTLNFARSSSNVLLVYYPSLYGYIFNVIEVGYYSVLIVYITIIIYRFLAPYITKTWYNKSR